MDYGVFVTPIIGGLVGAIFSAFGVYVAITNRLTRTETLIEQLSERVEKHNQVIERTYQLEGRVDALEAQLKQ